MRVVLSAARQRGIPPPVPVQILQAAGGTGSPRFVADEIRRRGISTVPLAPDDVRQLLDTLVADGILDRFVRWAEDHAVTFLAADPTSLCPSPRACAGLPCRARRQVRAELPRALLPAAGG